jgi:phage repressor protein C with HTH and peptisase S24 domain
LEYILVVQHPINNNFNALMGERLRDIRIGIGASQSAFADMLSISQGALSKIERGILPLPLEALHNLICEHAELDIRKLICGQPGTSLAEAQEVAALIRPVIRPLGAGLQNVPEEQVADDYFAVPLVDGRAAAGPGGVIWEQVKSMVWVYRPELDNRRHLVAIRVGGNSMEPTIPDGAIVIVDKADWQPDGGRPYIWAVRTENGDTQVKRLKVTDKSIILISDNFHEYPPDVAWTGDMKELIIGKVIWMWRSLF